MSAINHIWSTPAVTTSSTPLQGHNQAANQSAQNVYITPAVGTSNTYVVSGGGGVHIGTGQHTWPTQPHIVMSGDLEDPIFDMPIESLRAAWLACFGSGWIDVSKVQEKTMHLIYTRLVAIGEIEQINVMDSYTPKARLIKREAKCET